MLFHCYRAAQSRDLPGACSEDGRTVSHWACGVVNGLRALCPERLLPEIRSWTCTRSPPQARDEGLAAGALGGTRRLLDVRLFLNPCSTLLGFRDRGERLLRWEGPHEPGVQDDRGRVWAAGELQHGRHGAVHQPHAAGLQVRAALSLGG